MAELENQLSKIRLQQSSKQAHQKLPAQILLAAEETIETSQRTPTGYFAAFFSLLESVLHAPDVDLEEGSRGAAVLYLFATVLPFVPPPVVRTHSQTLFESILAPFFVNTQGIPAPALRSLIAIVSSLFTVASPSDTTPRQIFNTLLSLAISDARPKVRKRATEGVIATLSAPPTPLVVHPWADGVLKFIERIIEGKAKGEEEETIIHLLAFLKTLLQLELLPISASSDLPKKVMHLTTRHHHNKYIPSLALSLLPLLPSSSSVSDDLLSSIPRREEKDLCEAWVWAFSSLQLDSGDLERVLKILLPYISPAPSKTTAAIGSFLVANSAPSANPAIISYLSSCLVNVDYVQRQVVPNLFDVLASYISSLTPSPSSSSYNKQDWEAILLRVSEMRIRSSSSATSVPASCDEVFTAFIRTYGIDCLMDILPLNIEPTDMKKKGTVARAFLLPLFGAAGAHPTPLSHFIDYFVPMSERLYTLKEAENEAKAKVYQVLIWQIWSSLQGYLDCRPPLPAKDLQNQGWTPKFSALVSQVLYAQTDLQGVILKALRVVVESNKEREDEKNVEFLQSLAPSFLAVLFNVYTAPSTTPSSSSEIANVISTWSAIASPDDLKKTTHKIISVLQSCLSVSPSPAINNKEAETLSAMVDLLIIVIPYLSVDERRGLWEFFIGRMNSAESGRLGKKGWKVLVRLVDGETFLEEMSGEEDLKSWVGEVLEKVVDIRGEGSEKDRLSLLSILIPHAPSSTLSIIPDRLLPEIVLATKDTSEKTRNMAFELLVIVGQRMKEGGVLKRPKVGEDEEMEDVGADVKEYVTMLAAGLVGGTPHMISASIGALARVVFEFQGDLPHSTLIEILQTLLLFLASPTREIIKSTLGFMKIAITTFPTDEVLTPNLSGVVKSLMPHAKDHGNHFKVRVVHIFERMARRWGWDDVERAAVDGEGGATDEEALKVLRGARRRKERAKRKKKVVGEAQVEDGQKEKKKGEGFDDVLYGSESEDGSEDGDAEEDENDGPRAGSGGAQLRMDDDEPMDLLEGVGVLSGGGKKNKRKPGQEASKFKHEDGSGKMIIAPSSDEDEAGDAGGDGGEYLEAMVSTDGYTRGPNGAIKFNKDTKKRRRLAEEMEMDVDEVDGAAPAPQRKKKKEDVRLGKEFKAKKAGGDMKKGGVDPFAYLPLSQAAKHQKTKKGGKKGQAMGITGRK